MRVCKVSCLWGPVLLLMLLGWRETQGAAMSSSYTEVLPRGVRNNCAGGGGSGYTGRSVVLPAGRVGAAAAQQQCRRQDGCVVGVGTTLVMDGNLNVGALTVLGKVEWTDSTQQNAGQYLCAGFVAVEGQGEFHLQVESASSTAVVFIKNNGAEHESLGRRGFGGVGRRGGGNSGPRVTVKGRRMRRTWSLLAEPAAAGATVLRLLHKAQEMGWREGDRVVLSPTVARSEGTADEATITRIKGRTVTLSSPLAQAYEAKYWGATRSQQVMTQAAEIINLRRTVVITGDDFQTVACQSTGGNGQCIDGLHTVLMFSGIIKMEYARVEKCGQRGRLGKYCLHYHVRQSCTACTLKGNAVEYGHQRGVVVHATHEATVEMNVFNDVRGGNLYIAEDGNELYNNILYNVAICPWPHPGCTAPGTDNDQGENFNAAGMWGLSKMNHVVGNRVANFYNGMIYDGTAFQANGRGVTEGRLCPKYTGMQRFEGNTFHGNRRFGTYFLDTFPKNTDMSLATGGMTTLSTCQAFKADGTDNGQPVPIANNFDYGNDLVGQYDLGDVQFLRHTSVDSYSVMYWKTTKNFADGCSAHMSGGTFADGAVRLPDQGTFLMEGVEFRGDMYIVSSHHCGEGVTGVLCNPTYVFSGVRWSVLMNRRQVFVFDELNRGAKGGMFVLAPDEEENTQGHIFPKGYCALADATWEYLTGLDNGASCKRNRDRAYGTGNILCRRPLRRLNVFARGHLAGAAPLHVEVWQGGVRVGQVDVPFWRLSDQKQGYALPVAPLRTGLEPHEYRISLGNGVGAVPADWIIEFSDPIFENRWGSPDTINLKVEGRSCPRVTSSSHDRRFIWGGASIDGPINAAYGHGACTRHPSMPVRRCPRNSVLPLPLPSCSSCNGDFNEEKVCGSCRRQGKLCTGRYLGSDLPPATKKCL